MSVTPGTILVGKYRVERALGEGGMGVVVAAHHVQLDTKVAIKLLRPEFLRNPEAVSRFVREARAAVKIKSEHVARVTDVGTLDDGAPYMVMEFLEGSDVSTMLRQSGAMPIEQAVEFLLHACVAVAEAHGLGIIHRDLKPSNLFCVRRADGQQLVKVLDFGISKSTSAGGAETAGLSITKTTAVMGSPLYMSPEQMQSSKTVTAATDIWALGVILYELLTRHPPFNGEAITEVAVKVAMHPPPPMKTYRPDLPDRLEAVVLRCLEKDPTRRYANVAELAIALSEFAPKRARGYVERILGTIQSAGLSASALALPPSPQLPAPPPPPADGTLASNGTSLPTSVTVPDVLPRRSFTGAIVGGALVLVVALGVMALVGKSLLSRPAQATGLSTVTSMSAAPPVTSSAPIESAPVAAAPSASAPPAPESVATPAIAPPPQRPHVAYAPAAPASGAPASGAGANVASAPAPASPTQAGASAGATSASCATPYTLDQQGRKHFRPECFKK